MGAAERQPADPLARATAERGGGRPFESLIAFIERLFPDAGRLGTAASPSREVVRLRHDPSFAFSAADVSSVAVRSQADPNDWTTERKLIEITSTFLGLTGTVSPLPSYITDEVLNEDPDDPRRRAFLDVFHHRLLSLLYRAATEGDWPLQYAIGGRDQWSRRILALAGVDPEMNDSRRGLPEWCLLRIAPLLVMRCRHAEVLRRALQDVLQPNIKDGTVEILQNEGAWVPFDSEQQIRLGQHNSTLGVSMRIGSRVRDCAGKFRVRIGPVPFDVYGRFRPGQDLYRIVDGVMTLVLRDALDWDIEVVIAAGYAPPMRLSAGRGSRLGHESWLGIHQQAERRVVVQQEDQVRS